MHLTNLLLPALLLFATQYTSALSCYVSGANGTIQSSSNSGGSYTLCFASNVCVSSVGTPVKCSTLKTSQYYVFAGYFGNSTQDICTFTTELASKASLGIADYSNICCTTDLCNSQQAVTITSAITTNSIVANSASVQIQSRIGAILITLALAYS